MRLAHSRRFNSGLGVFQPVNAHPGLICKARTTQHLPAAAPAALAVWRSNGGAGRGRATGGRRWIRGNGTGLERFPCLHARFTHTKRVQITQEVHSRGVVLLYLCRPLRAQGAVSTEGAEGACASGFSPSGCGGETSTRLGIDQVGGTQRKRMVSFRQ